MRPLLLIPLLMLGLASAAGGAPLNQDECVRMALSRNSGLTAQSLAAEAASWQTEVARSALLPALSLKGSYTLRDKSDRLIIAADAFGPGAPLRDTSISTGSTDSYGILLTLRQPLYTGGALTAELHRSRHEAAAAEHGRSRQATLLAYRVRTTHNEALIAEKRVLAAQKGVAAAAERLRVARARHSEGYAHEEELLRSEADMARAETRLIKSRNRSRIIISRLRSLLGMGPDEDLTVAGEPSRLKLNGTLEEVTGTLLERREDLRASSELTEAAGAAVEAARSGYLPRIFLEGNYLRQKETSITRPQVWSLGVQAEWSLFEWGRTTSSVQGAVAKRNSLAASRDELERTVRLEVEEAWQEVIELQSLVTAAEKTIKAEEAGLTRIIVRWSEGAARLDEVITREAALWDAYDNYCQSAAALSSAFAGLEAATSADLSRWTVLEPLYHPHFEDYAILMKAGVPQVPVMPPPVTRPEPEHLLPGEPPPEPSQVPSQPPSPPALPDQKPEAQLSAPPQSPPLQEHLRTSSGTPAARSATYRLQLGAFGKREQAHAKAAQLAPRIPSPIRIVREGKFFKLIAGPFPGAREALLAAAGLDDGEYLVRSSNGTR